MKADSISKMEVVMEFGRFPIFLGNERASGVEIGSFGVLFKTLQRKLFALNGAFRGMERQCAERVMETNYSFK